MKKYVSSGILFGVLILLSLSANATPEYFIREDVLPVDKYDFHINNSSNTQEKQEPQKPCNENLCPVNEVKTIPYSNPEQQPTQNQIEEKFSPCEELQRNPYQMWKDTINNDTINALFTYYEIADKNLNLTSEQKVKSDEIKQKYINKIIEHKEIADMKKSEIVSFQTSNNQDETSKKIKSAEKYIAKLDKQITKLKQQLDDEYYSILTPEQKTNYEKYKKSVN